MFKHFPQVIGVANDNDEPRITAMMQALEQALRRRKEDFAREGAGNLKAYRTITGEKLPYLVVVVDNFAPVYQLYPQLEEFFLRIGREGGNYGIYLVATAGSTMALGYRLNQCIKTALVLQMTDHTEYGAILGRTGGLTPQNVPGRGLLREGNVLEFQTALPTDTQGEDSYLRAIRDLGEKLAAKWGNVRVREVAVMPEVVKFGTVSKQPGMLALGLACQGLQPVVIQPGMQPSLLISGMPGSGKTTLLKSLIRQAGEEADTRIVVYGDKQTYAGMSDRIEFLLNGEDSDAFFERLSEELTLRQEQKKQDPTREMPVIFLMIDGYRKFFEEISQRSASRLRALLMLAAGLGVMVVAAEDAARLSVLVEFREPAAALLTGGCAVLLGGKAVDHTAVETALDYSDKLAALGRFEGWYRDGEQTLRLKLMNAE